MDQVRRYFFGLVAFGVVVAWATIGLTTTILALTACAATVAGQALLHRRAVPRKLRREVRTRPLRYDTASGLPLVPDEPSLIVEV